MSLQTLSNNLDIISELVIPSLEDDIDVIQKLDDEPNDVGGLTAAELKAKFDESGNIIKKYLNETLVPKLSDTVAEAEVRAAAERERVSNENIRIESENERIKNEDARKENENTRVLSERARAEAEAARTVAEDQRGHAESDRVTAEKGREDAEDRRATAEADRNEAEEARNRAEQERVNTTDGIVAQAAQQAQTAAASASHASQFVTDAATEATNAKASEAAAAQSASAAKASQTAAKESETAAKSSEKAAAMSAAAAAGSETAAKTAQAEAESARDAAKMSEENAGLSNAGAQAAAARAESARDAILDMTVEAETLEAGMHASVVKTEANGVYNLSFGIPKGPKGDTGSGLQVLDYYDSLEALEAAVPYPNPGDAYGVGTKEPYDIYIYGKTTGWKNNGPIAGTGGGLPFSVEILETICENVELTRDNNTYTLPAEITLDSEGLYCINYKTYRSGELDTSGSGSYFARVTTDDSGSYVRWLDSTDTNSVTLTSTQIADTWMHYSSALSIYRVILNVSDEILDAARKLEGYSTTASGNYSHAEGRGATASGYASHAEGRGATASGYASHAEGRGATASGNYSHAEGEETTASGYVSHAEGYSTTASGNYSHAEGYSTTASVDSSHAEGYITTARGETSHAEGRGATASGYASHAEGYSTTASNYASHAQGKYNKAMTEGGSISNTTGDAMVIGNGTRPSALSNAFRVTYAGEVYGLSTFNSTGADYSEFFEWTDLNLDAEDRVGYFVTLEGKQIRIANPGDYILGIVSGQPCIIGNADEDWQGRWLHDEFGRFIKEETEDHVMERREVEVPVLDENGNQTGKTKKEMQEVETGEVIRGWRYKANPDYDPTQAYIERKDRQEWDCVGMLGVLAVRDDGSCEVNGYCQVASGGIATKSDAYLYGFTYRVVERVADNVVKIIFK